MPPSYSTQKAAFQIDHYILCLCFLQCPVSSFQTKLSEVPQLSCSLLDTGVRDQIKNKSKGGSSYLDPGYHPSEMDLGVSVQPQATPVSCFPHTYWATLKELRYSFMFCASVSSVASGSGPRARSNGLVHA